MKSKSLSFSIKGNQKNPYGNPMPYKRTIANHWRADATQYMAWKEYVKSCFYRIYPQRRIESHPITLAEDERARMDILISWADETHGDEDNIWKGICDSLFKQDKHVSGSFASTHSLDKAGHVEVVIEIGNML